MMRSQNDRTTMPQPSFVTPDQVRSLFSKAMSDMYRQEVPQYGTLLDLVSDVNALALQADAAQRAELTQSGELGRLEVERHGAIRLGTASELSAMRRVFNVMGMRPVGYYDLSVAGVPVHSTAFRPITNEALRINPFRMFTSLLRLELIKDVALREEVSAILARRKIFTAQAMALTEQCEQAGGLTMDQAQAFVAEVKETFRWHGQATVDEATYHRLHAAHRLLADVVCFRGPHLNHLTPRTLNIDEAQAEMPRRGMAAKDVIEGPPPRRCPILLRQTSFKALDERVAFVGQDASMPGSHTARFGEIEQRGMALTRKGRALYDQLLSSVRDTDQTGNAGDHHTERLVKSFAEFPDDLTAIRQAGLAYFTYTLTAQGQDMRGTDLAASDLEALITLGHVQARPITYEDFLPVSAAGIFQSNLGGTEPKSYEANEAKSVFEVALGSQVLDELQLYEDAQTQSITALRQQLTEVADA